MSQTLYSHVLRILTCAHCGAPIDVDTAGGRVECRYCGNANQLGRRDESADLAQARETTAISESERVARLRAQDRQPAPLPDSIAAMVVDGHLPPDRVEPARAAWRAARAQLEVAPSFPVSERLFHLTVLLVPHLDERQRRATLETAVEMLPDEGHRHILRCVLARYAAMAGDVAAARAWLAPCNPRPLDLGMDTSYRLAVATLAHVGGDARAVVEQLGMHPGDVPLADRDELGCWLLRIDALERLGQLDDAARELEAWARQHGVPALDHALAAQRPLSLCPRSFPQARQRIFDEARSTRRAHQQMVVDQLKNRHAALMSPWFGPRKIFGFVMVTALCALVLGGGWSCVLFSIADVDPLLGYHAKLLCPRVCGGCRGPYRTASWSTSSGGETSTHSATYCQDRAGPIAAMTDAELWTAAVQDDPRVARYEVPGSGFAIAMTTVLAFAPLGMILAVLALVGGYRHRRRRRAATEAELARAEEALARM